MFSSLISAPLRQRLNRLPAGFNRVFPAAPPRRYTNREIVGSVQFMTGKKDWHWTKQGWKRTPHRMTGVKKIAMPPKRKTRKRERVAAAAVDEVLTFFQARRLGAAKLAADEFLASVPKDAGRRRLGHYADLGVKENRPAGTFLDPPAH